MAKPFSDIKVCWETRLCEVDGRPGYFHTWEQFSKPVEASPLIGGPPAGVIAQVFGIVEFSDGVERVKPYKIKFSDEENQSLREYEKWLAERQCGGAVNER